MRRAGWRRSYYQHLAGYDTSPNDSFGKPWLSSVTPSECAGAEALADVVTTGDEMEFGSEVSGRYVRATVIVVPSLGHKFSPDLSCHDCLISWEDHQLTRSFCRGYEIPRYVEPEAAPEEPEEGRRERVDQFETLYPVRQKR